MAEIDAEAMPIASGGNCRAANHQYAKPRSDVTAVVPTNDPALTNKTLLDLIHRSSVLTVLAFLC